MEFDLILYLKILWICPGIVLLFVATLDDIRTGQFGVRSVLVSLISASIPLLNIIVLTAVIKIIERRRSDEHTE